MEEWKDIKDYEGRYQVSSEGRVRSLNYGGTGKEKLLRPQKRINCYFQIGLWKEGKVKRYLIHRLVWNAFNGTIPEGFEVNHIDENKENNSLDNLNLMTSKENINWGSRNERVAKALSKTVVGRDKQGNILYVFPSTQEAGRNGFKQSAVSDCCNGKRKTHKGFYWSYQ